MSTTSRIELQNGSRQAGRLHLDGDPSDDDSYYYNNNNNNTRQTGA